MKNLKKISLILLLVSGVGLNFGLQANSAFSQTIETKKETTENQGKCVNNENHQMMGNNHEMMMGENTKKCKNQEMINNNKPMDCCGEDNENNQNNPKPKSTN